MHFFQGKCSFVNIYVAVTQPGVYRIVYQSNISSCSHCLFVFCFIVSSRQQFVNEILLKIMCFVQLTSKIPTDCSDSQGRGARWKSWSKLDQHQGQYGEDSIKENQWKNISTQTQGWVHIITSVDKFRISPSLQLTCVRKKKEDKQSTQIFVMILGSFIYDLQRKLLIPKKNGQKRHRWNECLIVNKRACVHLCQLCQDICPRVWHQLLDCQWWLFVKLIPLSSAVLKQQILCSSLNSPTDW